jgi:hypothetical protein
MFATMAAKKRTISVPTARSFWMTTGAAAILTAILSGVAIIVGAWYQHRLVSTIPPTSIAGPSPSISSNNSPVRYSGARTMEKSGPGLILDTPNVSGIRTDIHYVAGNASVAQSADPATFLALWPYQSVPLRGQCLAELREHAVEHVPVTSGTQLCVRTMAHRIAYLKIVNVDDQTIGFNVLVWQVPAVNFK